jgi:glycosyltransferase involved in cell wall biosynthesis
MISIVIPAFNEAENIASTARELAAFTSSCGESYEIIVVDDHSDDNTFQTVKEMADPHVASIRLSRRSGSHIALRAGLARARGDAVLCIAADGQDDPSIVGSMIEKWKSGVQLVWALRKDRKNESLRVTILAKLFYWVLGLLQPKNASVDFSRVDFYLLDRRVVEAINSCRERNTSLFALIAWLGFVQDSVVYDRKPRKHGSSKWSFRSRLQLAQDWIVAFSALPLKLITRLGIVVAFTGFLYAAIVFFNALWGKPITGWSSLMVVVLIMGGCQMIMLGVIGEYLWRNLEEARSRPSYFIERETETQ